MRFAEIKRNILNIPHPEYRIAHCVSADLAMGAGVAELIANKYFDEVQQLRDIQKDDMKENRCTLQYYVGKSLALPDKDASVIHLVTKEKYNHKPTYETLALSLHHLRKRCLDFHIQKLAMPTIGCGLDRLEWPKVRRIIQGIFSDTDVDIVICHLRRPEE